MIETLTKGQPGSESSAYNSELQSGLLQNSESLPNNAGESAGKRGLLGAGSRETAPLPAVAAAGPTLLSSFGFKLSQSCSRQPQF